MLSLRGNNISSCGCCTREEFSVYVRTNNKQLLKYFDKYFRYSLKVIGETVSNSHKYVEGLVAEKRHKPFVSELRISIQRRQHKQLEDDIENGYHRCNQLKELIKLVKEIVSSSIISLIEDHVNQWLSVVMSKREGARGTSGGTIEKEEGMLSYDTDYSQLKTMLLNPLTNSIIALFTAYEAAINTALHEEQGTPSLSLFSGTRASLSQFKMRGKEEGEEESEESLLSNCLLNESLINDLENNEVLS
uniref:Uncharacterized protein n=1 Tax=Amphimedon queenslandica TaxID=400682 RepID=A0A1X7TVI3_AMPQE